MKKIPTLFERDWNTHRSRVTPQVHAGCEWVLAGEGRATRKLDGTCCLLRDGKMFKRRELRNGELPPPDFEIADHDEETLKTVGWIPIGDGTEDRWHRDGLANALACGIPMKDGTYELVGPKVQGNPEKATAHDLIPHGPVIVGLVPRTFDGLRDWLAGQDIEGIVFHHPDGRMAKIKLRDFGLNRPKV